MDDFLNTDNNSSSAEFNSSGGFDSFEQTASFGNPTQPIALPLEQEDKYSIQIEDDNSPLSIYHKKHSQYLDEKSAKSERRRQEILAEANVAIENFYKRRTEERENKHSRNRQSEERFLKENTVLLQGTGGNEWERVTKLIDFKQAPVGRDTARLRKLLLELKH